MALNDEKRKKVSIGLIVKNEDIVSNKIIPKKIIQSLKKKPYFLLIYIIREDIVKINIFPIENKTIKKILINLKDFSPELVNGISNVLKDLNLSDYILHTTGICYAEEFCFYETYINIANLNEINISLEKIKEKFSNIPKINNVKIEDIPLL